MEQNIVKNIKTNPEAFWQYVQSNLKIKASIPDLIKPGTEENPSFTETDEEKAGVLSNYFSSAFRIEQDTGDMPFLENRDFKELLLNIDITEDLVIKKIKKLKTNKSPGPDTMHPPEGDTWNSRISGCATNVYIFKISLATRTLPNEWKHANITAILKKGRKPKPQNYTPVNPTSIICKTMESIFRDAIIDHMKSNKLFSPKQFGFITGGSTVLQLLHVLDIWSEILDQGETCM